MRVRARDRGQAVLLVVALVVVIALTMAAMARFGARVVAKEQAQAAADAAALAGATRGRERAADLAERNGGSLVAFVVDDATVTVVVRLGGWSATARATRAP